MANNYSTMTGVVKVKKMTPIIELIFGMLDIYMDKDVNNDGECYIADGDAWCSVSFDAMMEACNEHLHEKSGHVTECTSLAGCILELCRFYKIPHDKDRIFEIFDPDRKDDYFDSDLLFQMATLLNDGHDIEYICVDAAHTCSKMRLFEFSGTSEFRSSLVSDYVSSFEEMMYMKDLHAALLRGRKNDACLMLRKKMIRDLKMILDEGVRQEMARELRIEALLIDAPPVDASN